MYAILLRGSGRGWFKIKSKTKRNSTIIIKTGFNDTFLEPLSNRLSISKGKKPLICPQGLWGPIVYLVFTLKKAVVIIFDNFIKSNPCGCVNLWRLQAVNLCSRCGISLHYPADDINIVIYSYMLCCSELQHPTIIAVVINKQSDACITTRTYGEDWLTRRATNG